MRKIPPDNKYRGENKIQLRLPDGSRSVLIAATSTSPIKVTVRLTSRRTDAVTLQLNLTGEAASSLTLSSKTLTIPRRAARGRDHHHTSAKGVTTQQQAKLSVTSTASGLMVEGDLTITISPFPRVDAYGCSAGAHRRLSC